MLKIIAGDYRSRRLRAPRDESVSRPYSQRVKEAVFNLLRGWFDGARVLDLFAGVGTMGLEAVSRGAAEVVMVERDSEIFGLLEENVAALGCGGRVTAVQMDALSHAVLLRAPEPVDVVFIDPPYALMEEETSRQRVLDQAARCRTVMADSSFLVLRSPQGPEKIDLAVEGLAGPEPHRYGLGMWVLLYAPTVDERDQVHDAGSA